MAQSGSLSESDDRSDSVADFSLNSYLEHEERRKRGRAPPPGPTPPRWMFTPPKERKPIESAKPSGPAIPPGPSKPPRSAQPPAPSKPQRSAKPPGPVEFPAPVRPPRGNYLARKVKDYDNARSSLLGILHAHIPTVSPNDDTTPLVYLVKEMGELLEEYISRLKKLNIPFRDVQGHESATNVKFHDKKILSIIEEYEKKLENANEEIKNANEEIKELRAQHQYLSVALSDLEEEVLTRRQFYGGYVDDLVPEEQFMEDIMSGVKSDPQLSSSTLGQPSSQTTENDRLRTEVANLSQQLVEAEEDNMRVIMNLSQKLEFNSMMEDALRSKIDAEKEPNKQDCQDVIDEWKKKINEAIEENAKELTELYDKADNQNKELASVNQNLNRQSAQLEAMKQDEAKARSIRENHLAEISKLTTQNNEMKQLLENLQKESFALSRDTSSVPSSRQGASSVGYAGPMTISPARMRSVSSPRKGLRPSQTRAETSSRAPVYPQQTEAPRTGGTQTSRTQRPAMGSTGGQQRWSVSSVRPTAVRQMLPRDNIFLAWDQQRRSVQE